MTTDERKAFFEGKTLWNQYVGINGYAFEPTDTGLKKLAQATKQSKSALKKKIHVYLSH